MPPSITGTLAVGQSQTVDTGSSSNELTSDLYQWLANGSPISGANGPSFSPNVAQVGALLGVIVTAANGKGATAVAAAAGIVAHAAEGASRLIGAPGVVSPPSTYSHAYTPPFTITRQAAGPFTTSYSIDAAKPAYANTIHVGLDGNNAGDRLT